MKINIIIDIAGWIGVASLLIAYALVSIRRLAGDSTTFQLLNLAGSVLLSINSFFYGAYPSVGINIAWITIALYALFWKKYNSNKNFV